MTRLFLESRFRRPAKQGYEKGRTRRSAPGNARRLL